MTNLINFLIALLKGFFCNTTDETKKSIAMRTINKLQGIQLHNEIDHSSLSYSVKDHFHALINDVVEEAGDNEVNIAMQISSKIQSNQKTKVKNVPKYIARCKRNKITRVYTVTILNIITNKKQVYHTFSKGKVCPEYIYRKYDISVETVDHVVSLSPFKRLKARHIYAKPFIGNRKKRISRNGGMLKAA